MSEIQIDLTLTFNIPDEGLNVNGLLFGLKNSNSQIMLGILKTLLTAIEQRAIQELKNDDEDRYIRNGRQRARTLKTSFGSLQYRFAQIKDQHTDTTIVPLREALKIPKYRRYQDESMESAVGLAVHLSFNRSDKEVTRIRGSGASKWTVWRRLHEFSDRKCQFENMKKIPYTFLMPDGTGVHLQGSKGKDLGQKQMRWALASCGVGQDFDLVGIWIDKSWAEIAKELKSRLNYDHLEVLISDGEPGLIDNLLEEGMRHQRCTIHGKRDFPYILYADHIKKPEQKEFRDILESIPALNFSKTQIEKLSEKDREKVAELWKKTETSFDELIGMLDPEKYPKALTYIQNLSKHVTLFFQWWLEKNEWIPFTSNIIENRFSQVKNRIKRIGRRWSDTGLLKWLMVVIKKIFTPEKWDELWKQFLQINEPIELLKMSVSYRWI